MYWCLYDLITTSISWTIRFRSALTQRISCVDVKHRISVYIFSQYFATEISFPSGIWQSYDIKAGWHFDIFPLTTTIKSGPSLLLITWKFLKWPHWVLVISIFWIFPLHTGSASYNGTTDLSNRYGLLSFSSRSSYAHVVVYTGIRCTNVWSRSVRKRETFAYNIKAHCVLDNQQLRLHLNLWLFYHC